MSIEVTAAIKREKVYHSINEVIDNLKEFRGEKNYSLVSKAYKLFTKNTDNHKDITGYKYHDSLLTICIIAIEEMGLGETSVIGIFLCKCLETGCIKYEEIKKTYGESEAIIAEGLNKISDFGTGKEKSQAETFRKFLLNLAKDIRVVLIKLAEHLYYFRQIKKADQSIQLKYAHEASYLYAPLAHRLGLYLVKSEMEDIFLKYTDRKTYDVIAKKLDQTMKVRKNFIEDFIDPIKKSLEQEDFSFEIKGRPKSIHSIYNKMRSKQVEFEDIYDLFAIRIILESEPEHEKSDCWKVYSIVSNLYQPNPLRLRDWISVPKSNGYESLHTTVIGSEGRWVEVQIRTRRMNEIAEKGFAAHWKYKGMQTETTLDDWLMKVRDVLENPVTDDANFIDDFKLSLYSKEIFVFTPKGDLKKFPAGATVLDFAFDIHSDLGASCIGAKINGKNVSIKHVMQNGDRIEIQSGKNQKPKMDWLNFVVTSKAKSKIRQKLNEEKVKEAEIGKELIKRRLKNWKVEFSDAVIRKLLKNFKLTLAQEFYYQLSTEKIDMADVKDFLLEEKHTEEEETVPDTLADEARINRVLEQAEDYLVIDDRVNNVDYKLAKCCNPVFGDRIFGFVTVSEGIKIHRVNCSNAAQMIGKYGYRVVKASWTKTEKHGLFPVDIKITGDDQSGMLKSISELIAKDTNVTLRRINMDADSGELSGSLKIMVKDLNHLDFLIKKLQQIKGVYYAGRIENVP